ncbi:serine/threonine protein kinase [Amylibacter sp.]|nr:serine/threonine protein kinase [Amylibacter sp.]
MISFKIEEVAEVFRESVEMLSKKIEFTKIDKKAGSGFVLFGKHQILNDEVAVKFYHTTAGVSPEPQKLATLKHPNILRVNDAEEVDDDFAFFVAPYCAAGDLDDLMCLGTLGVKEAIDLVAKVTSAIAYLHSEGFIHRDLKPQNIFLTEKDEPAIGDFGSVIVQGAGGYTISLTKHSLLYRPPEDILYNHFHQTGDIYQLGILLFQLLGGHLPYDEIEWLNSIQTKRYLNLHFPENQIFAGECIEKKICGGKLLDFSTLPKWVDNKVVALIRKAVRVDPNKRHASASDFQIALHNVKSKVQDWQVVEEWAVTRIKGLEYRVLIDENSRIQKRRVGSWKNDNTFDGESIGEAVVFVEGKI